MIRINLLPFRAARKKENIRRQVSIFLLSFIFAALVIFYYNGKLNGKIHELNTRIDSTKTQVAGYDKINREITNIKKKLEILKKKTDVIKNLESNRMEPVRLLDTMTEMVIPKRMWFTSLEAKEMIVVIKGIALDNKTVADFMTRLEGSKLFASVDLKTLKQQKIEKDINLKGFEITCNREKAATGEAEK